MNQNLTIEQLKFASEIGATHIELNSSPSNSDSWFYRKDEHAYEHGEWSYGFACAEILDLCEDKFARIDFTPLDDYYADKDVDIAATSVPDGYYHDDESGKLKPMKPSPAPDYDPADVAFKRPAAPANERGAGLKFDSGKPRMSLLPPHALTEMANVMTFGAQKYAAHSWKNVENAQERYLDALLRHAVAYVAGERIDPESGKPTMAHIMCNAAFLIELERETGAKQ